MTLIELVVVLVIIMALAASSIVMVDRLSEQAWIDRTDRNLDGVTIAIDGGSRPDGAVGGFLADMGRWPVAPAVTPPVGMPEPDEPAFAQRWMELTQGKRASDGTALPGWDVRSPSGDPEVKIACGWRGPYLTGSQVWDGWETALRVEDASGPLAWGVSGEIHGVRSLGQDRTLDLTTETTTAADRIRRCRSGTSGTLKLSLRCLDATRSPMTSGFLLVRIYAVREGGVQCIWQSPVWDLASPGVSQPIPTASATIDPLLGVVAVRAYHLIGSSPASWGDAVAADASSQILYRTIAPWTTPADIDVAVVVP